MQNTYFNPLSSFIFFITSSYLHSVIITDVFLIPFCELRTVCRRRRWGAWREWHSGWTETVRVVWVCTKWIREQSELCSRFVHARLIDSKVDYTRSVWKGARRGRVALGSDRIGYWMHCSSLVDSRLTTLDAGWEAETTRRTQRWNENAARPYR